MDAAAIERIEASFKRLSPRGPELVDRFHAMLFARYPAIRPLFPVELCGQADDLLNGIATVIRILRNPGCVQDALFELGRQHARDGMQPAHYVAVRDTLIDVMSEMAGAHWNARLTADWKAALDGVAAKLLEGRAAAAKASA